MSFAAFASAASSLPWSRTAAAFVGTLADKARVDAALRAELVVRPLLLDAAVGDDGDLVGVHDG